MQVTVSIEIRNRLLNRAVTVKNRKVLEIIRWHPVKVVPCLVTKVRVNSACVRCSDKVPIAQSELQGVEKYLVWVRYVSSLNLLELFVITLQK